MKQDIAVKLTNISKRYYLHSEKPTFVENLNPFKKPEEFWALKDINLTIKKGDRIGIIGPNGSGKTTLLKIIAGITKPTTGTIQSNGKVVSLIELTAGFHPEMSGTENIFICGILLGMSKELINKSLKKIIAFADIGKFINQPVYTYSNGMLLRLGISIAIHSKPDIFISDEMITVGDTQFQQKIIQLLTTNRDITFIIASNKEEDLIKFADKIIETKHSNIINIKILGDDYPNQSIQKYEDIKITPHQFRVLQKIIKLHPITACVHGISMYPNLKHNQLTTVNYIPFTKLDTHQIAVFYSPTKQTLMAHRLINKLSGKHITRGDNVNFPDKQVLIPSLYLGISSPPTIIQSAL